MTALPRIEDVPERSIEDERCFEELREVLRRHDAVGRFGVLLLHSHFDLDVDELLVETVDLPSRTMTIAPTKRTAPQLENAVQTQWRLDEPGVVMTCVQYCQLNDAGGHRHVNADPPQR